MRGRSGGAPAAHAPAGCEAGLPYPATGCGEIDWSRAPAPDPALRAVVIVPARDEAGLLPRALHALRAQTGVAPRAFEVLVLANNCSDDTAERARAVAAGAAGCPVHVVDATLAAPLAHVGAARRALFDEASLRLAAVGAADGVLLSTDADTRVAPDWVAANLAEIRRGVDAVGGRILTRHDGDGGALALPAGVPAAARLQRLDTAYQLLRSRLESLIDPDPADPWPRHHQHFGASLAVSAAAYRQVGGQPVVPYLEDEALVEQLRRHDLRIRHSPTVRVWTSDRLLGRAEVGLAWQLRQWAEDERAQRRPVVPDPATELALWRRRAQARALWSERRQRGTGAAAALIAHWADKARVSAAPVTQALASAPSFGAFWHAAEAHRREAGPMAPGDSGACGVDIDAAVRMLRRWVRHAVAGADIHGAAAVAPAATPPSRPASPGLPGRGLAPC